MQAQSTPTEAVSPELIDALVQALGQGTVLLGDDVTQRGAGIWRSDNIQAQVLVRRPPKRSASPCACVMNLINR